jgi:hypothetical protein
VGGVALGVAFVLALTLRGPRDRVVTGDVEVIGLEGPRIPDGARLRANRGGSVVFGSVSVEFAEHTEATWRARAQSVELSRGQVLVDVTPGKGRHFRVITPHFLVEVIGTRFAVDMAGVRTDRGTVHVKGIDGTLFATLTAGQRWRLEAPPSPPSAVPLTSRALSQPTAPPMAAPMTTRPPVKTAADPAPDRLVQARQALTRGDADQARSLLVPLYHGSRNIAVEARALAAESYLIEGRYGDAIESYGVVVRDFNTTPQAESALYAIAQLQIESSRREEAVRTLRQYLSRYPDGRFANEARERLEKVASLPLR